MLTRLRKNVAATQNIQVWNKFKVVMSTKICYERDANLKSPTNYGYNLGNKSNTIPAFLEKSLKHSSH